MERQLPKNVRQIGNVSDNPKIYVEDYVDTYLNQLREKAKEQPVGVILAGEVLELEDEKAVFVSGAVQMQELSEKDGKLEIGQDGMKHMMEEAAQYFPESHIVGWGIVEEGNPMRRNREVKKIQEREFGQEGSLFLWKNAREQDEIFYAYKFGELMQIGGHYIYYEKNPQMQNYMINTRRQNGVTPSEMVEDRAAKDFRSAVRQRMEIKEQSQSSKLLYATSALLVVVVLAIGVSMMNNFERMESVQQSLEQLASAKGTEAKVDDNAQVNDQRVNGENENQINAQSEGQNQEETKENQNSETVAASGSVKASSDTKKSNDAKSEGTVPEVSTVQEQLSQSDYYTVKKGDTLASISKKTYGDTGHVEAICKMNGLSDGNLIFIGQKLLLP